MRTSLALVLVLVFLTASSLIMTKPVSSATVQDNSWVSKSPMHVARSDLGVAVANGKIYAIGGNTENGYMPNSEGNDYKAEGWIVNANEEDDPITDKWTFKMPMPTPRYNFAIATYQNKIYCMGGVINWASGNLSYAGVNEVYDTATDTWETKAPMPIATNAQANVVNSRIYIIGGGSNETLNQAYDPATDSWSLKSFMPIASRFYGPNNLVTLVSASIDNKIYVMSCSGYSSLNWIYNPINDSWSSGASLSPSLLRDGIWWSQAEVATSGIMASKRIYVFFGVTPFQHLYLIETV